MEKSGSVLFVSRALVLSELIAFRLIQTILGLYPAVLPLRLVWLSGWWRLIGGGDITVSSIALVMVADRFPEEEMYA